MKTVLLYFAYGSNMSALRLRQRLGEIDCVGSGFLPGHRLRFHKRSVDGSAKADAEPTGNPSDGVHGVLWNLAPKTRALLDRFEGLGNGYEDRQVLVEPTNGAPVTALTYIATQWDARLRPYPWYLAHVILGAESHQLPAAYVATLRRLPWQEDPEKERTQREMAIYPRELRDPFALLHCNPPSDRSL